MRKLLLALGLFVLFIPPGCSATSKGADFDEDIDFTKVRTWEWLPKEEWRKPDAVAQNDRVARGILNAIDDHLTRRGFRHIADTPDFLVTFLTGVRDGLGDTRWGYGYGGQERYGGSIPTSNYREGRLVIDFLDAKTRTVIWRGWAEVEVGGYEDAMVRLRTIVDKVLTQFPPPVPMPAPEKP